MNTFWIPLITWEDIDRWVQKLPNETPCGVSQSTGNCPLAKYLDTSLTNISGAKIFAGKHTIRLYGTTRSNYLGFLVHSDLMAERATTPFEAAFIDIMDLNDQKAALPRDIYPKHVKRALNRLSSYKRP